MSMRRSLKVFADRIGLIYTSMLTKKEYDKQQFIAVNERPVEFHIVFKYLASTCPRTILDVGTGITALPMLMRTCGFLVTAIDNIRDYWPSGMVNRHYHVIQDDITKTRLEQTFDFITCISVLEHVHDHPAAMRSMFKLLNPGGHLVVTFPYNEKTYCRNVYEHPASSVRNKMPFITQAFSRNEVANWLANSNCEIIDQEFWRFFTGDYWTCGDRICPPVQVTSSDKHQISCLVIRKKLHDR